MIRKGFGPEKTVRKTGVDLKLLRCPLSESAKGRPELICQLHLGFVEGLVDEATVVMSIKDPTKAGCLIAIEKADK